MLRKLLRNDAPAKIRRRLILRRMRARHASPLTVTRREAEALLSYLDEDLRHMTAAIAPYIPERSCVFDIGANAGMFSRRLLEHMPQFRGTLVLFEPITNLLAIAIKELEPYPAVEKVFVNAAIGDENGEIDMFLPPNINIGWITAAPTSPTQTISVKARLTAAKQHLNHYRPDVIKIDVEGYEGTVLNGIVPSLSTTYRPVLLVEVEGYDNAQRPVLEAGLGRLATLGYTFAIVGGPILSAAELLLWPKTVDVLMRP
jgi:FkbM family methyltransferase